MRILSFIFNGIEKFINFGRKYKVKEEEYHADRLKFGPWGQVVMLILYCAVPLFCLWGVFHLPWDGYYILLQILMIIGCFTIFKAPTDLFILGVIALRHRAKMKIQSKVEGAVIAKTAELAAGEEITEQEKADIEDIKQNHEAVGTAHKFDLAIGILGISFSILVVGAFIAMLCLFFSAMVNSAE